MSERNYYIILEVKSTATFEEIKISYRILAKKYHPDKNIGNKAAEEYFKEIQQAYAILSNPEKRRKYDLKFSYSTRQQSQQKNPAPSVPYTGNAYQYAQQQAQYQQKYQQARQNTQQKQPEKKDNSESWQILVSVGIAMVLLYFIISYSSEKPKEANVPVKPLREMQNDQLVAEPAIGDFESPYSYHFGDETGDRESKNSISIMNSILSEAVVCLVENKAGGRTIRNQYMSNGSVFKMNEIPDGEYFLKVYFGKEWDREKTFLNGSIKGGFKKENVFAELNTKKEALKMKKATTGASDSYSTYEIAINPFDTIHMKMITAEEFFKK